MRSPKFEILICLTIALASCGPRDGSRTAHLSVIGGIPAKAGEFPETVALLRNNNAICSATVIAKRAALTAAHCVEAIGASDLKLFWGEDASTAQAGNTIAVSAVHLHPQLWADYLSGNDLALLMTEDDIPVQSAPLAMTISASSNALTLTGFGVTSNTPAESTRGIKNWASAKIQHIFGNDLYAGNQTSDTCQGDSGGPAFLTSDNGTRYLFGVTSRGPTPCAQDRDPGIFTLVQASSCWLLTVLASADSTWQKACDVSQNGRALNIGGDELRHRTHLTVKNQSIKTIDILAQATALTILDLSYNQIVDPSPLLKIKSLRRVDLRNNQIADLTIFDTLRARGIEVLGLYSQAQNIAATDFLRIAKLGFDAGTDNRATVLALRDLLTTGDNVRKSRDLAMRHSLGLSGRGVRSLEPLSHLENLSTILLSNNPLIKDLSPLKTLPALKYLDIRGTGVPLQDETQQAIICDLRTRGVVVVTDAAQ